VTIQIQSVVAFNSSPAFLEHHVWSLNSANPPPPYLKTWTYFPKVALHELGHLLGLAHNDQSGSVMYSNYNITLPYNTTLESFEIDAVNDLYFWYSPIVSVGDYITLNLEHNIFDVGTTHAGCVHANFTCICGEIPPCTLNDWNNFQIFALSDCGEVLIYDSPYLSFTVPNLPLGYRWARDENGDVPARVTISGTDSRGAFHETSEEIKIHGVPNEFLTSGTLNSNTHWCGNVDIIGDLIVPQGVTLYIHAASSVRFLNNSSLIVNGALLVEGQPVGRTDINFIASNSTYKNGIKISAGGTATINYAVIQNGYNGIYVNEANVQITESEFLNCYAGVHLYRTNYTLDNSVISDCKMHDNDFGILIYYSSPLIKGNAIYNNWRGIGCADYSSPSLGNADYYGKNHIYDNNVGVFAYGYSNPFLGRYSCTIQGGFNSIEGNTYKDVNLNTYSSSIAENNWWGISNPQSYQFYVGTGCRFDYNPWLTDEPDLKISTERNQSPEEKLFDKAVSENIIESTEVTDDFNISSFDPKWSIQWQLLYARNLIEAKKYKPAQKICKDILTNYPDSTSSYYALDLLWKASRKNRDNDSLVYFINNLSTSNHNKYLAGAAELIALGYEKTNRIKNSNKLLKKHIGEPIVEFILFHKFLYYLNEENNIDHAREIANELLSLFPESESTSDAFKLLDETYIPKSIASSGNTNDVDKPSKFELLGNYPNPFNPSTNIRFAVPFSSGIEITIYDLMGNTIKNVFSGNLNTGYHTILWDGTNNNGFKVSSGLYLYRFKAKANETNQSFEASSKLLLIK